MIPVIKYSPMRFSRTVTGRTFSRFLLWPCTETFALPSYPNHTGGKAIGRNERVTYTADSSSDIGKALDLVQGDHPSWFL